MISRPLVHCIIYETSACSLNHLSSQFPEASRFLQQVPIIIPSSTESAPKPTDSESNWSGKDDGEADVVCRSWQLTFKRRDDFCWHVSIRISESDA